MVTTPTISPARVSATAAASLFGGVAPSHEVELLDAKTGIV
jgi:hypothetical protein